MRHEGGLTSDAVFRVEPNYVELLRQAGIIDAWAAFEHPSIRVWRTIRERENATLDIDRGNGAPPLRLHVKRDREPQHDQPAGAEAAHLIALSRRGVPTAPLAAYGQLPDGRSFVITEHLAGFQAVDKLVTAGGTTAFERVLIPTAEVAARLHAADAYHRDLYLCHFFARPSGDPVDVRLIDCARVLVKPFWRRRWMVKDLAQLVYSTRSLAITPDQLDRWFNAYARAAGRRLSTLLRRQIEFKADQIARHDRVLRRRQPDRSVSIPD